MKPTERQLTAESRLDGQARRTEATSTPEGVARGGRGQRTFPEVSYRPASPRLLDPRGAARQNPAKPRA